MTGCKRLLGVFSVCSLLDWLRIRYIEKPVFDLFK